MKLADLVARGVENDKLAIGAINADPTSSVRPDTEALSVVTRWITAHRTRHDIRRAPDLWNPRADRRRTHRHTHPPESHPNNGNAAVPSELTGPMKDRG